DTVVLNLTKVCNLWCSHCMYPVLTREREAAGAPRSATHLPWETLQATVDEIATWTPRPVLRVAADGEPLIHPRGVDMIAYAKSRGVAVALTTNGIALR